jgi:predicted ATPase
MAARECAENLLQLSEKQRDTAAVLLGHAAMGNCLQFLGQFASSRYHLERVLAIYAPETHRLPPGAPAVDVKVRALTFLAYDLFMLGYQDQALSRSEQAVLWSRALRHSHSLAYALTHAANLHLYRGDETAAFDAQEEAIAIATQQGFPLLLASSTMAHGYVLATRGEAAKGLALARKGHADMKATGTSLSESRNLSRLAKCFEHAGQPDEAFDLLTQALEIVERAHERIFEAELHRQKGEWLVAYRPSEPGEAELCFERALTIAQKQNARTWQLRAAISLARLWLDQGKRDEARNLLAPIYAWFTEGFDTPILRQARALLDELAQ